MAKKRAAKRKQARSKKKNESASDSTAANEHRSGTESSEAAKIQPIEGASPNSEPLIDESAGVDAAPKKPEHNVTADSGQDVVEHTTEGKSRFDDLDEPTAENEYAICLDRFLKADKTHQVGLRRVNILEDYYQELDDQDKRGAAYACRLSRFRLVRKLKYESAGLLDLLGQLNALGERRFQLKASRVPGLESEMSRKSATAATKKALTRRLSLLNAELAQLAQQAEQNGFAIVKLRRPLFNMRTEREELSQLKQELDERKIKSMPRLDFEKMLEERLARLAGGVGRGEPGEGERAAGSSDVETADQVTRIGNAMSELLTAGFGEGRLPDEVAAAQRELFVEQAKEKAKLLRHDLEIDNRRQRVLHKEALADLYRREEEIRRKQQKWFFQHLSDVFRLDNRYVSFLKVASLAILGVCLAIAAVTESAARQKHLALLDERIRVVKSEIIDVGLSDPVTTTSENESFAGDLANAEEKLFYLQEVWGDLKIARETTVALMLIGVHESDDTLGGIRELWKPIRKPSRTNLSLGRGLFSYVLFPLGLDLAYLSNDKLLGIILVCCGTLGALIIAIRRRLAAVDQRYDGIGRYLLMGFVAGFIALLAIKGGKQVFVNQIDSGSQFFNPWSAAFLGIITGLFTDRAYSLLLLFVDRLEERVRLVFGDAPKTRSSRENDTRIPAPIESAITSTPTKADPPVDAQAQQE